MTLGHHDDHCTHDLAKAGSKMTTCKCVNCETVLATIFAIVMVIVRLLLMFILLMFILLIYYCSLIYIYLNSDLRLFIIELLQQII